MNLSLADLPPELSSDVNLALPNIDDKMSLTWFWSELPFLFRPTLSFETARVLLRSEMRLCSLLVEPWEPDAEHCRTEGRCGLRELVTMI